ncbi:MAG TPA: TonB-dependent receptor, partial [Pricia sp.]|nr:TonB-dependent receptor [Pricia sp.]
MIKEQHVVRGLIQEEHVVRALVAWTPARISLNLKGMRILLLGVLLSFPLSSIPQTAISLSSIPESSIPQNCNNTLSGTVTDLHDGSALAGATLIVAGTEQVVETDLEGKFVIPDLCERSYSIQVYHPYCLTRGFTVKVTGDTEKNFRLEHHLEELKEVTLSGKAVPDKTKTLNENEISEDELERFSSGSLGDALNGISGVSSLNTGNTVVKPMINGLHSSRVLLINNGVRMEDQQWGAEHAPNVDVNSVGRLTLIKGAGALQYGGDAVGGVIVAEAQKVPIIDSLYGKTILSAASNGRGAALTSRLTKSYQNGWYATVQGSVKRFGDFEAPDYVLSNTGTFGRNFSLHVGRNRFDYGLEAYYSLFKNEIGILRASHLGGAQDQIQAIASDRPLIIDDFTYVLEPPKQDVTHHLARIKGFKRFDGLGKWSLQYDFQRNNRLEFDIRRGNDRGNASLDLQLDTHTLKIDFDSPLTNTAALKAGLMGRYQNNFADPGTGVRRLIPDYDQTDVGVYGIIDYRLNGHWLFEAGGRFDYSYMDVFKFYRNSLWESRGYDQRYPGIVVEELDSQILVNHEPDFRNVSATLGSTYSFGEVYTLLFNYSLASRAPNPSELYSEGLHHSASRIELGDLGFDSEIGHKLALTLQRKGDRFNFSVQPFLQSIHDFILIEPTGVQQTIRG